MRDHCRYTGEYRGAAHSICNVKYGIPEEISIVFHNECNYYCHFMIKELTGEFEGQFTSLGENAKKYITFSAPVEKEVARIDKVKEIRKTILCRLQFINSVSFIAISLSILVNNFTEGIYKIKCQYRQNYKRYETYGIKYKDCDCLLEYTKFKNNVIEHRCLC